MIKLLGKQMESIREEVCQLVEADAEQKRKLEHISKIKGVGLMSAGTVIAETNGLPSLKTASNLSRTLATM